MQYVHINFWTVLIAATIGIILEMVWYSPKIFGEFRAKQIEKPEDESFDKNESSKLIISFISFLITAYILSYAMFFADAATFYDGLSAAFYIWLGFVAATTLYGVLYEERLILLYILDNSLRLISLLLMGGILAVWR